MLSKRNVAAAEDKKEAPPAKTAKGEKKIKNEEAPPKSQQQGATGKKEYAPETADVSLIEATQAVGGEEFVNNCAAGFNMMLDSAAKLSAQAIVAEIIRGNENKKAASPPKKNKGEIEPSPAKIIKDKEKKKCSKLHELY